MSSNQHLLQIQFYNTIFPTDAPLLTKKQKIKWFETNHPIAISYKRFISKCVKLSNEIAYNDKKNQVPDTFDLSDV